MSEETKKFVESTKKYMEEIVKTSETIKKNIPDKQLGEKIKKVQESSQEVVKYLEEKK